VSRATRLVRGAWTSAACCTGAPTTRLRWVSAHETIQISSNRVKAAAFREWYRRGTHHPRVDISRPPRECDGAQDAARTTSEMSTSTTRRKRVGGDVRLDGFVSIRAAA
jgi:hypothetical protein